MENTKNLLYIVGTGPCLEEIEHYLKEHNITNVKLLGFKSGKELTDIVGNARAVILPSEWYENCPFSVMESQMYGTPVIGADIGGIPELIQEGKTGELFESGNVEQEIFDDIRNNYSKDKRKDDFER